MEYKEALVKQIAAEIVDAAKANIQPDNWELAEGNRIPDWTAEVLTASKMLMDAGHEMEAGEIIVALAVSIDKAPAGVKIMAMCTMIEQLVEGHDAGL